METRVLDVVPGSIGEVDCLVRELQGEGGEADDVLDHNGLVCPLDTLPLVHAVDLAHPVDPGGGVDVDQKGEAPVLLTVWVLFTPREAQGAVGAGHGKRKPVSVVYDGRWWLLMKRI